MEKRVSLIVGGSGGIGVETARFLHSKGMDVCLTYHSSEEKIRNKLKEYKLEDLELYRIDVKNEESVNNTISDVLKKYKKIDSVIYSVSSSVVNKRINDLDWRDFQEHIDVQIKGLFILVMALMPLIKSNHKMKFVVVLTEGCVGRPPSMLSHYITAKYGLMGFVKCMVSESILDNCTFNMVSPGMVKANLIKNFPHKLMELTASNNPMKRIAEPEDVAKVICFLTSDDSDYINGANIIVNGGNIII